MATTLSSGDIVTLALRQIGRLSPIDTGADPAEHRIGLQVLDLILADIAATETWYTATPVEQSIALVAGQRDYALVNLISPPFLVVTRARYRAADATCESEVTLIPRTAWDALTDKQATGTPSVAHILDDATQTLRLHPTPGVAGSLLLTGQQHSQSVADSPDGSAAHGLPNGWQTYLVKRLAADLGSGPILAMAMGETDRLRGEAAQLRVTLAARSGRQHLTRPLVTRPWGM